MAVCSSASWRPSLYHLFCPQSKSWRPSVIQWDYSSRLPSSKKEIPSVVNMLNETMVLIEQWNSSNRCSCYLLSFWSYKSSWNLLDLTCCRNDFSCVWHGMACGSFEVIVRWNFSCETWIEMECHEWRWEVKSMLKYFLMCGHWNGMSCQCNGIQVNWTWLVWH